MRKFILNDPKKKSEFVFPVTPPSFEVSHGINIETVNIHTLGDVILPGYGTLSTIKVDCMFPAKKYRFNQPGTKLAPYDYINKIITWCDKHTILGFVVSDTEVNIPVLISDLSYGEKDGTGDVYATLEMREYKELSVIQQDKTGNKARGAGKTTSGVENYVIKLGDTLSAICRKYYGNASLSTKLAAYNEIKNANLIFAGDVIKLPDQNLL